MWTMNVNWDPRVCKTCEVKTEVKALKWNEKPSETYIRFVSLHLCLFSFHAALCRKNKSVSFILQTSASRLKKLLIGSLAQIGSWHIKEDFFPGGSELFSIPFCLPFSWEEQTDHNPTLNTNKTEQHLFQLSHVYLKNSLLTFLFVSVSWGGKKKKTVFHIIPFSHSVSLCQDSCCSCSAIPHLSTRCLQRAPLPCTLVAHHWSKLLPDFPATPHL